MGELRLAVGIAEGVENSNYLIEMQEGEQVTKYILTLYEKRVRAEDLPFFIGLMRHLASKNIPCPLPIVTPDGRAILTLAERQSALISFLNGRSYTMIRNGHVKELGAMMAKMHLAAQDFTLSRPNDLSVDGWQKIVTKCASHFDEIQPGLEGLIKEELHWLQDHWPRNLPRGIIHADLFPDNVFFEGETLTGVIDFYFACEDMFAYELAICLNCWCFEPSGEFNITKAQRMLKAYDVVRPLSPAERAALPVLARGAALRFLLTRAHDKIYHPPGALVIPKDPLEYQRKLQFHQRVKGVGEYGM